jgi:hypothetical protein
MSFNLLISIDNGVMMPFGLSYRYLNSDGQMTIYFGWNLATERALS